MAKLSALSKYLKEYGEKTTKEIVETVGKYGSDLQLSAMRTLDSYNKGQLESVNFIQIDGKSSDNGLTYTVGVPSVGTDKKSWLPIYIEFGTGLSAKSILAPYPADIKEYAWQFKSKYKDGTLIGHPYLFNNYQRILPLFTKELNTLLKK